MNFLDFRLFFLVGLTFIGLCFFIFIVVPGYSRITKNIKEIINENKALREEKKDKEHQ